MPGPAHARPRFIGHAVIPVAGHLSPERSSPFALIRGVQGVGLGAKRLVGLVRIARGHHGPQQGLIDLMAVLQVEVGACVVVHLPPGGFDRVEHRFHPALRFLGDGRGFVIHHGRHAKIPEASEGRGLQGELVAWRVDLVRAGLGQQQRFQVAGASGNGPNDREVGLSHNPRCRMAPGRQQAPGGLMAEDAAVVGRVANGAADVRAVFYPGKARGHGSGGAPGGAPGVPAQIPGIIGGAVDVVVGLEVGEIQRHVGFAKERDPRRL